MCAYIARRAGEAEVNCGGANGDDEVQVIQCVCVYVRMCVCVYTNMYLYIYTYIYIYIYIYMSTPLSFAGGT